MWHKIFKLTSACLTAIFGLITIVLFVLIATVAIEAVAVEGYVLQFNTGGIIKFQEFWETHLFLLKSFAGCATIFIAGYNLTKYVEVARIESLSALREKLNDDNKKALHLDLINRNDPDWQLVERIKSYANHQDVQLNLSTNEANYSIADIYDYLGVIELGAQMLKSHVISIDEFYNQFGYRVKNILECSILREHIGRNIESYDDLLYVVNELITHNKIEHELKIFKD